MTKEEMQQLSDREQMQMEVQKIKKLSAKIK